LHVNDALLKTQSKFFSPRRAKLLGFCFFEEGKALVLPRNINRAVARISPVSKGAASHDRFDLCFPLQRQRIPSFTVTMSDENLVRKLGVCEPIPRAFKLYFKRAPIFVPIGLIEVVPILLFSWMTREAFTSLANSGTMEDFDVPKGVWIASLALLPIWIFIFVVGQGATIRATGEIYADKPPILLPCLAEGYRRGCALFCFGLIWLVLFAIYALLFGVLFGLFSKIDAKFVKIFLMLFLSLIALFVVIYVFIAFQVTPPSIVLERKGAGAAMRRSWSLVKGRRSYVFCVVMFWTILSLGMGVIFHYFGTTGYLVVNTLWNILVVPAGNM
jgi:hypothetical protein